MIGAWLAAFWFPLSGLFVFGAACVAVSVADRADSLNNGTTNETSRR